MQMAVSRALRRLKAVWRRHAARARVVLCLAIVSACTLALLYPVSNARAANEQAPLLATSLLQRMAEAGDLATRRATEAAPDSTLVFSRQPDVSAAVFNRVVHGATDDQARADAIADALRQLDPVRATKDLLARYGLSGDNLADVMAAYWVNSWEVVSEGASTDAVPSGRAMLAVEGSLKQALLENAALPKLSDAQKQAMADSMIYQSVLASAAAESMGKTPDPARRAAFIDQVNAPFAAAGVDLRQLSLTEEGFIRR
ncbi:hypothetical protein SAMN07250955_10727 [Arboricoccus pini]|uniref:Uncharacterized protein n=1 Tax=Arboricoccus pini TaxID=1963835 RepID=A0A212RBP9_9PROT|nr:DUF6683 family protein [Arboricoccus pini]SNB69642.1 hypothetical protein SAMN07250955_10727 [Arboricoccus pini]